MNQPRESFGTETWMRGLLAQLVERLAAEVARLRALRGDGRHEAFAGLMLRDGDITDLCREMGTPDPSGNFRPVIFGASTLGRLVALYDLTEAETALVILTLAPAVDPRFGRIYGFLHEDMTQSHVTAALALRLMPDLGITGLRQMLSSHATLVRHGLIRMATGGWITARLDLPETLLDLILGTRTLPEAVTLLPLPGQPVWPQRPRLVVGAMSDTVIGAGFAGALWLCDGPDLARAQEIGVAAALAGATVAYHGWDGAPEADRRALLRSLGRHGAVMTEKPDLWQGLGVASDLTTCGPCTHAARLAFWQGLCPDLAAPLAFSPLPPGALWPLVQEALTDPQPTARLGKMLAHRRAAPMRGLADRVECPHDFDALILPEPDKARLRSFARRPLSAPRVLERWGLGLTLAGRPGGIALFTGPSGVGKTMAAGVVARAAGLDLMRINLASVVSKYIGETESNLEQVFTAAALSQVILFFDEAEALFSKRAEVKDARDRYANMEMSYLLQRIESFHGMAILASNMEATLDPALLRRFDLVLDFALPDAAARRRIWGKITGGDLPLGPDVDLDLLAARFDLAGGHIRQAILTAAHEAAQAEGVVTQALLIHGIAREYVKLGRTLRREDFGTDYDSVRAG